MSIGDKKYRRGVYSNLSVVPGVKNRLYDVGIGVVSEYCRNMHSIAVLFVLFRFAVRNTRAKISQRVKN